MGVFLYSPEGEKVFVKDSLKTTGMIKEGYTFEPAKKGSPINEHEDDIRQAAKAAGIGNWHNKKIDKLTAELEALED